VRLPPPPDATEIDERRQLRRLFPLIVIVEVVTIAALYWFGRHFS
jgi:hypothetical protein